MFNVFVQTFNVCMPSLHGLRPAARHTRKAAVASQGAHPPDRRQAILIAAEKLFSQRGYHGVTIREIALEASVPLALVGYYFGPKHELFHAIFVRWQATAEQRLALLQQTTQSPGRSDHLRQVVEAFVLPVLAQRASAEGEYYAQLVARELARQTPETQRVLVEFFDPLAHRFIDALHAARPGSDRATAAWAYQFALGALLHHISDHRMPRLSKGRNKDNDPAAGALLIDFIVAGLSALLPASRTSRPRAPTSTTNRRQA